MQIIAPCPGRAFPISEVSDPVFAAEMVGPGVAIEPVSGRTTVISPASGKILKLHPHAFALLTPEGVGVLVHLGINTVRLDGAGFEVLAVEGSEVSAGDPIVSWDPGSISGDDLSTTVMVVALDRPAGSLVDPVTDRDVTSGEVLFSVEV